MLGGDLHRLMLSTQDEQASASEETDLKRHVVGHVASDGVDVLEMCDSRLQVSGSFWVSNDGKDNSIRSAGLENNK